MADPFPASGFPTRGLLMPHESRWLHTHFPTAQEFCVATTGVAVLYAPEEAHAAPEHRPDRFCGVALTVRVDGEARAPPPPLVAPPDVRKAIIPPQSLMDSVRLVPFHPQTQGNART